MPAQPRPLIAQILSITKILLIGLIVSGQNPFQWLGVETPNIWSWASSNKFYASIMLFFVSNAIEGQLMSSGAFEVYFNDVPVWSKLETGRIPAPHELFQIIENHIRLSKGN